MDKADADHHNSQSEDSGMTRENRSGGEGNSNMDHGTKDSTPRRLMRLVITIIAVAMSLYHLVYVSGLFIRLGIPIMAVPHRAASLGFTVLLIFLFYPATKKFLVLDAVLSLGCVAACGYYVINFDQVIVDVTRYGAATPTELVFALFMIIGIFEAARRVIGLAMPLIMACFFLYTLFSNHFPGILRGTGAGLDRAAAFVLLSPEGLFGLPMAVGATIIIMFVLFGQFLNASGGGKFFIDLSSSLFGHFRGGPAKVSVVASALFGSINGSTAANVATTGVITIPLMKRAGYRPEFAGAVEAVSSNGGQILPPVMGAVAFVMAEWLNIPYITICYAAFLPALVYFIAVIIMVDLEAAKSGIKGLPRDELPVFRDVIKTNWHYLIPIAALLTVLIVLRYSPEASALYSLIVLVFVTLFKKEVRMGTRTLIQALQDGAKAALSALIACAAAGIIIGCLGLTGLGLKISGIIVSVAGGNLIILLLLAAAGSFILGMGMTAVPCYITLAILVAPALEQMGVPLIAAHLFCFYWGIASFISPPVAVAAYVASGIADCSSFKIALQAVRLGFCTFIIPFVFAFDPALIMIGSPAQIVLRGLVVLLAVAALAAGISGYLLKKTSLLERIFLIGGAIALIEPSWKGTAIGIVPLALVMLWQVKAKRIAKSAQP